MLHRRFVLNAAAGMMVAVMGAATVQAQGGAATESMLILKIDVAGLVGSQLYKDLTAQYGEQMASKDPNYLQFKQATGFNPESDLKSITMGIAGDFSAPNPKMYIVMNGKFDQAKIQEYAKSSGKMTMGEKDGLVTFTPTEQSGSSPPPTFAITGPDTMIAATTEDFSALAAGVKGGSGIPTAATLTKALGENAKGQIQLAMLLPETAKAQLQSNPQSAAMASIQTILLAIDLTQDLNLSLRAAADNEANGKNVFDAFNGFLALGKMMSAEQPAAQQILNQLKLEQQGAATQLSLNVKAGELTTLVGQAMAMAAGAGAGAPPAEGGEAAPPAEGGEEAGEEAGEEGGEEAGEEGAEAEETPAP